MIIVAFGNLRRRLHGRAEPRDKEVFMYLSEFIESLALYGLPAVVMSVLAEGCTLLLVRLCRIQNTALKNILPFLFGVAFSCLYSLIFQGAGSVFTEETLYTGILCGSLSTVYGAILNQDALEKSGARPGEHRHRTAERLCPPGRAVGYGKSDLRRAGRRRGRTGDRRDHRGARHGGSGR